MFGHIALTRAGVASARKISLVFAFVGRLIYGSAESSLTLVKLSAFSAFTSRFSSGANQSIG